MHHEMNVRKFRVDRLDDPHRQNIAIGLAGELIGVVRSSHRDRERIDLCPRHEIDDLIGVGQELFEAEFAFGAMSVFLVASAGFERPQDSKFALDRNTGQMRHLDDLGGDSDVIIVGGRRLRVGIERAIHHHR